MGAVYRSQFRRDRETPPVHKPTDRDIAVVLDIYRHGVLDTDLAAFNGLVEARGVPAVIVPGRRSVVSTSGGRK